MSTRRSALAIVAMMCGTSVLAVAARPTKANRTPPHLKENVPKVFGDWTVLPESAQVVDPSTEELLRTLYGEVLTRTYGHKDGYRIMLSMAYGSDQSGALSVHKPEVCYPAQGFKVSAVQDGTLATAYGSIEVRRLQTSMGARLEPVTYWITVGDQVVKTPMQKRMAQFKAFLTGELPDGLLFRVSSIDADADRAFAVQQTFVAALLAATPAPSVKRFSGLDVRARRG